MERIAEQARQMPPNATPIGWSDGGVIFPAVNTCLTITSIPDAGPAIGLHLGMCMYDQKPSKELPRWDYTKISGGIPEDQLAMYLGVMSQHIGAKQTVPITLYVAGCVDLWKMAMPERWTQVKTWLGVTAQKFRGTIATPVQFDDEQAPTVDIHVTDGGARFYATGTTNLVKRLPRDL